MKFYFDIRKKVKEYYSELPEEISEEEKRYSALMDNIENYNGTMRGQKNFNEVNT